MPVEPRFSVRLIAPHPAGTRVDPDLVETPLPGSPLSREEVLPALLGLERLVDQDSVACQLGWIDRAAAHAAKAGSGLVAFPGFGLVRLRTLWKQGRPSDLSYIDAQPGPLLLFVESFPPARLIEPRQFGEYLERREDWEQADYYLCSRGGSWCWCLTHDDDMELFDTPGEQHRLDGYC